GLVLPGHGNRSHEELNELLGLDPDINDTSETVNSPNSNSPNSLGLKPLAYANLKESGLSDEYIKLMRIQQAQDTEDYVIPYFDFDGHMRRDFYRTRLIRPNNNTNKKRPPKYLQPKDTPNHIWLPPNLSELLASKPYLIITEGEKKAASVAQHGIPAVALGGVDSWRNRKYAVDLKNATKTNDPSKVLIDAKEFGSNGKVDLVAEELGPLAYFLQQHNKTVFIVFDTDNKDGLREEVQAAAFKLTLWLEGKGLKNVKLAVLPPAANGKMGLDDFVVKHGPDEVEEFLKLPQHSFPTHPSPDKWIKGILDTTKVTR
ncbi:MAG: DUF3854 domain-containing protein, partial [Actinobacteria bacterium]|nr:DUF3854 domain-containing protein [Actinomycetota bacterium]MCA1806510.1 DUF3854 domain-containing protein [Actinomycetota bacterium]